MQLWCTQFVKIPQNYIISNILAFECRKLTIYDKVLVNKLFSLKYSQKTTALHNIEVHAQQSR